MSIQSIYTHQGISAYEQLKKTEAEQKAETAAADQAAADQAAPEKEDLFIKSAQYTTDIDKVNAMKSDLSNNMSAFRMMVQGLIQKQGAAAGMGSAMDILLEIGEATQLSAQQAISEDGEWGVEQTAQRILDFAMALSGGDPEKAAMLRGAFEKGFEAAEKVWGGTLPDISYQTRERVLKGFDEWENGGETDPEVEEVAKS